MNQLTELLGRLRAGDPDARNELFAAAYGELHQLARARLGKGSPHTVLDTTSLVDEAYTRFVGTGDLHPQDRQAFFAYASEVMRSVIVNSARDRIAQKGSGRRKSLPVAMGPADCASQDEEMVLKVDEALTALEQADPRLAQVAVMRYFAGYSDQEIATTLAISDRIVQRDWEKARLILATALRK